MTGANDMRVLPFGPVRLRPDSLSAAVGAEGRIEVSGRVPFVTTGPGAPPARFNGGCLDLSLRAMDPSEGALAPADFVRARLTWYCEVFDKMPRLFVDRYLEAMDAHLDAFADDLDRRLAPFGTLYRRDDWIYSALAPLPRAHVPTAPLPVGDQIDPDDFIAADFAFWTGARIVAVFLVTDQPTGPTRQRAEERLAQAGVAVANVPVDVLRDDEKTAFAALLPAECSRFWEGEPFPTGPIRPPLPAPQTSSSKA